MVIETGGRRGLTIAELIVAMGLLGLVIVSVLVFFSSLLVSSEKGNDTALGVIIADRVLDHRVLSASPTYPAFPLTFEASEQLYAQNSDDRTTFLYSVTASEVTPGTNPLSTSPGQNWLLEVEVRWKETQTARSGAGSGQLFVRRARLVYSPR